MCLFILHLDRSWTVAKQIFFINGRFVRSVVSRKLNRGRCCCYTTPSEGSGRRGTPRRPKSRATYQVQGLNKRSKTDKVEPKMVAQSQM